MVAEDAAAGAFFRTPRRVERSLATWRVFAWALPEREPSPERRGVRPDGSQFSAGTRQDAAKRGHPPERLNGCLAAAEGRFWGCERR